MKNEIVLSKAQAALYETYMDRYNQNQALALGLVYVMAGEVDALVARAKRKEDAKKLIIPGGETLSP
jgi:hypothetical protein